MKSLKKLSCSINLQHLAGKSYEKELLEVLFYLFTDFKEQYSSNYLQYFYYADSIDEKVLNKFKNKFTEYSEFVKFEPQCTFNIRNSWYVILTEQESKTHQSLNNRSYCIIQDSNKDSIIKAFLDFHYKASLLTKIRNNNHHSKKPIEPPDKLLRENGHG